VGERSDGAPGGYASREGRCVRGFEKGKFGGWQEARRSFYQPCETYLGGRRGRGWEGGKRAGGGSSFPRVLAVISSHVLLIKGGRIAGFAGLKFGRRWRRRPHLPRSRWTAPPPLPSQGPSPPDALPPIPPHPRRWKPLLSAPSQRTHQHCLRWPSFPSSRPHHLPLAGALPKVGHG
jgi:hypothetical protein